MTLVEPWSVPTALGVLSARFQIWSLEHFKIDFYSKFDHFFRFLGNISAHFSQFSICEMQCKPSDSIIMNCEQFHLVA